MPEAIIEKDFLVCWVLEYLFTDLKYKNFISFKGGTSLSKAYYCIERFSEDIDLALDWSILGIMKEDAYKERESKRKQDFFNKTTNKRTEDYLRAIWIPLIQNDFSNKLNEKFSLYIVH